MFKLIFRLFLTLSATSWLIAVYGIKSGWSMCDIPDGVVYVGLLLVPVALSLISLVFVPCFDDDNIGNCVECTLADQEFLPVYLGYFFVALSVGDDVTLCFIFGIVFLFTFLAQTQYFNPIFLLFGYHFYHVSTKKGTRVFVIARGEVIRSAEDARFGVLKRINNTTYIERKDKRQ